MKFISTVILSILILSNSLGVSFIYGWYVLDIESFVEQLCENKDRPQLQCNGKCYLSKMSRKESAQDEQSIPTIEWEQLVFCLIDSLPDNQANIVILRPGNFYYSRMFFKGYFQSVFHPPEVLVCT